MKKEHPGALAIRGERDELCEVLRSWQ
jgi:hypothetical protein